MTYYNAFTDNYQFFKKYRTHTILYKVKTNISGNILYDSLRLFFFLNKYILTLKNTRGNSCNTTIPPLDGASAQELYHLLGLLKVINNQRKKMYFSYLRVKL